MNSTKRKLLAKASVLGGAVLSSDLWLKPVINTVSLPAHAQTTTVEPPPPPPPPCEYNYPITFDVDLPTVVINQQHYGTCVGTFIFQTSDFFQLTFNEDGTFRYFCAQDNVDLTGTYQPNSMFSMQLDELSGTINPTDGFIVAIETLEGTLTLDAETCGTPQLQVTRKFEAEAVTCEIADNHEGVPTLTS